MWNNQQQQKMLLRYSTSYESTLLVISIFTVTFWYVIEVHIFQYEIHTLVLCKSCLIITGYNWLWLYFC